MVNRFIVTRFRMCSLFLYLLLVLAAACGSSASTPPPQTAGTPNERLSAAEFPTTTSTSGGPKATVWR